MGSARAAHLACVKSRSHEILSPSSPRQLAMQGSGKRHRGGTRRGPGLLASLAVEMPGPAPRSTPCLHPLHARF